MGLRDGKQENKHPYIRGSAEMERGVKLHKDLKVEGTFRLEAGYVL